MKSKFVILAAGLLITGIPGQADASNKKSIYNTKGQLIAVVDSPQTKASSQRASRSEAPRYVQSSSGRGGAATVAPSRNSDKSRLFDLFRSKGNRSNLAGN